MVPIFLLRRLLLLLAVFSPLSTNALVTTPSSHAPNAARPVLKLPPNIPPPPLATTTTQPALIARNLFDKPLHIPPHTPLWTKISHQTKTAIFSSVSLVIGFLAIGVVLVNRRRVRQLEGMCLVSVMDEIEIGRIREGENQENRWARSEPGSGNEGGGGDRDGGGDGGGGANNTAGGYEYIALQDD